MTFLFLFSYRLFPFFFTTFLFCFDMASFAYRSITYPRPSLRLLSFLFFVYSHHHYHRDMISG
jgi:hypothetical protein